MCACLHVKYALFFFGKKVVERKNVYFDFVYEFVFFFILKSTLRDIITNVRMSSRKIRVVLFREKGC